MTTLALVLAETSAQYPDNVALRQDDLTLTYAELDHAARKVAAFLVAQGVKPGRPVGLMLPNIPEFAICYYGILDAGGVVVPMNPLLKGREVEYYLADSGARIVITSTCSSPHARVGSTDAEAQIVVIETDLDRLLTTYEAQNLPVARSDDDVAVLLYTSGTTGRPKGAQLTHANLRHNAALVATTLLALSPDDVVLACLPLFHAFGQSCGLNAALCSGASVTLIARFSAAAVLDAIQRDRVTVFEGVPTMFSALLAECERAGDASSVRIAISGGAPLSAEVLREVEHTFGFPVLEGYGLSETSPVAAFNHPDKPRRPGSIGTPVRGVEMRLLDDRGSDVPEGSVGEIAVRGHSVMLGYHNQPEATRAAIPDGWFRTGDLARRDTDGYYYIVDRKKDLIIRGGYNVYPREIEDVLYEHPSVAQTVVIGIPHPELGEEVGAAVVLSTPVDPAEIREFVRGRVAAYKYPRRVWIVESLPTGPTGKLLRREVSAPPEHQF